MFTRLPIPTLVAFTLAALALAGCGDTWTEVQRGLGMEKVVPDEFAVTTDAPLKIPPNFTLPPPRPGAAPTQEKAPIDQARQTVFRGGDTELATAAPAARDPSAGEDELLKQAGAENAPKNIRQLVSNDAAAPDKSGFVDELLFWKSSPPSLPPGDQVIDPGSEAERLREAAASRANAADTALGPAAPAQPAATAANAPSIERTKPSGFFDWLF